MNVFFLFFFAYSSFIFLLHPIQMQQKYSPNIFHTYSFVVFVRSDFFVCCLWCGNLFPFITIPHCCKLLTFATTTNIYYRSFHLPERYYQPTKGKCYSPPPPSLSLSHDVISHISFFLLIDVFFYSSFITDFSL